MMMMNGQKAAEGKVAAAAESGDPVNGGSHNMGVVRKNVSRRTEVLQVVSRLLCLMGSVMAFSFMVTAHQRSVASVYGFQLFVNSKWSFSYAFEYLFGASVAAAVYSFLQFLLSGSRLLRKIPVISSAREAWLFLAMDQLFTYAMVSAAAAAAAVTNLNRTGIKHTALPNFCKALDTFCDHVAISIAFTFFCFLLLAASTIQDVFWLLKY